VGGRRIASEEDLVLKLIVATAVAAGFIAGPVMAQDRVTLLMRDGTLVSGDFEGRVVEEVYVRVTKDDQRRLMLTDVALIDVGGNAKGLPEAELAMAAGAEHVLVPSKGAPLRGRLMDIEGGSGSRKPNDPRMVYFRSTDGQEHRLRMGDVARLYLGNVGKAAAVVAAEGQTAAAAGVMTVKVPGNANWVPTGMFVRRGEHLMFDSQGQIGLSGEKGDVASPAGSLKRRYAQGSLMPNVLAGALIGMVGTSGPFGIGDQAGPIAMPADGQLFLSVNDQPADDNSGEFVISVRRPTMQ
jgi:hypothetical protein